MNNGDSSLSEYSKFRTITGEKRFTDIENIQWSGRTVWEYQHPTFVSHSRKAFLIAPRKTGHSTLRFALAEANEKYGDDWVWLEGGNRHPKNWLNDDDFWEFAWETHYTDPEEDKLASNVTLMPDDEHELRIVDKHFAYKKDTLYAYSDKAGDDFLGNAVGVWKKKYPLEKHLTSWSPFIMSEYFKDWKVYVVVREPWDRFISGLITELDNGLYTPWFTDYQHTSKELWEESYIRMKRLLLWNDAENILYGTRNGPQTDHTLILSAWKWDGWSMFDRADHFIPCIPDVDWEMRDGDWSFVMDKIRNTGSTFINKLKECNIIPEEIEDGRDAVPADWQFTNLSPPNRRHILTEATTNDEDLKPFFDRCKEIVKEDQDIIKKQEVKFL